MRTTELSLLPEFNYYKRLDKKGQAPVHLRIQTKGQTARFNLGFKILSENWDSRRNRVKGLGAEQNNLYNEIINNAIRRAESFFLERVRKSKNIRIKEIKDHLGTKDVTDFVEWCKEECKNNSKLAYATRLKHEAFFCHLEKFRNQKLSGLFDSTDVTYSVVKQLERFLLNQPNNRRPDQTLKQSYVNSMLVIFGIYCAEAYRMGIVKETPLSVWKMSKVPKKEIKWIHKDNVKKLWNAILSHKPMTYDLTRTGYVLSCCTGLRFSDIYPDDRDPLSGLRYNNIEKTPYGLVIKKKMKKTQNSSGLHCELPLWELDEYFFGIPTKIISEAMEGKKSDDFLFKKIANKTANDRIKEIAKIIGLKKYNEVKYHSSRDTFGMNLYGSGVHKDRIQELMVHSSVVTTEIYVNSYQKNSPLE